MATKFFAFLYILILPIFSSEAKSIDFNYPAVFNFGDSNSDTGDLVAALGSSLIHLMDKLTSKLLQEGSVMADSLLIF